MWDANKANNNDSINIPTDIRLLILSYLTYTESTISFAKGKHTKYFGRQLYRDCDYDSLLGKDPLIRFRPYIILLSMPIKHIYHYHHIVIL